MEWTKQGEWTLRHWAPVWEDKAAWQSSSYNESTQTKGREEEEAVLKHRGPTSWWSTGAQPCVVHYHTQQAASTTPPAIGRQMPPSWLPRNVARKAQETKTPAQMRDDHRKGRRSMPPWVYSSSGQDNEANRCRRGKDRTTIQWGETDGSEREGERKARRSQETRGFLKGAQQEAMSYILKWGFLIVEANSEILLSKQFCTCWAGKQL